MAKKSRASHQQTESNYHPTMTIQCGTLHRSYHIVSVRVCSYVAFLGVGVSARTSRCPNALLLLIVPDHPLFTLIPSPIATCFDAGVRLEALLCLRERIDHAFKLGVAARDPGVLGSDGREL